MSLSCMEVPLLGDSTTEYPLCPKNRLISAFSWWVRNMSLMPYWMFLVSFVYREIYGFLCFWSFPWWIHSLRGSHWLTGWWLFFPGLPAILLLFRLGSSSPLLWYFVPAGNRRYSLSIPCRVLSHHRKGRVFHTRLCGECLYRDLCRSEWVHSQFSIQDAVSVVEHGVCNICSRMLWALLEPEFFLYELIQCLEVFLGCIAFIGSEVIGDFSYRESF